MKIISVIIPAYKEARRLDVLLNQLINEKYKEKEIIVVWDEPKNLDLIKKYKNKVKFLINKKRIGKINAILMGFKESRGEIVVFLDSDVIIKTKDFFKKIEKEIKDFDILEFKKGIIETNFLSKLVYYEYLMITNGNEWIASKFKKPLGINGAGFAVKRASFKKINIPPLILEDMAIGLEFNKIGARYKLSDNIYIETEAPKNWKEWFKQKKRWFYGFYEFIWYYRKDYKTLIKNNWKPLFILIFSFLLPLFPLFFVSFYSTTIEKLVFLFSILSIKYSFLFVIPYYNFLFLIKTFLIFLLSLIISIFISLFYSIKLRFKYNVFYYLIYFLFYQYIYLFYAFSILVKSIILKNVKIKDWKV